MLERSARRRGRRGRRRSRARSHSHSHSHAAPRRTNSQFIHYDRNVHQSRPTNPPRNLPHQHPFPSQKNKIGCSSTPSPRRG